MPITEPVLWERIRSHPLPWREEMDRGVQPNRRCWSFEDNLRKDGDWTDASARRIVEEYRKFLYLKALDGGVLTPPMAIDAAWHLHLGFPAEYAAFCTEGLGRDLVHHEGLTRRQRLAAYRRLLELYDAQFEFRPSDIWPDHGGVLLRLTAMPVWRFPWLVIVWLPVAMLTYVVIGAFAGWPMAGVTPLMFILAVLVIWNLLFWIDHGPEKLASCG
jgi:hypothetical protein